MLKKDKDFEIVGVSNLDPNWAVRVLTGDLETCIVHFEKITLNPVDDELELAFSYNIVAGHHIVDGYSDEELQPKLGELLAAVIEAEMEEGTADIKDVK